MADAHEQLTASELSPRWRRRFVARERLSRSLVVVPGLYMLVALVLAELIPALEGERDVLSLELDPDTARTILSAVAGGMIAFTGLVVSIAVVVVQFGASQYTPRLVSRFQRDPVVKHALGLFVAPTVFSLVSLRTITPDVAPSITILVNLVLLVVAVLAFFALVERLLDLLRPRRIIGLVVDRAAEAVHDVYPFPLGAAPPAGAEPAPSVTAEVLHEGRPAVLSALDRARLVRAAKAADVRIELDVGIGGYVPTGTPLYRVCGDAARLDLAELRRAALFADERTIAQDPAFAIRAIVDLALRALSAAINDPTTAVQAIDGLEALLLELAGRDLERGRITDEEGRSARLPAAGLDRAARPLADGAPPLWRRRAAGRAPPARAAADAARPDAGRPPRRARRAPRAARRRRGGRVRRPGRARPRVQARSHGDRQPGLIRLRHPAASACSTIRV